MKNRIWLELERPKDAAHAAVICTMVNRMLARLCKPEDLKTLREVMWDDRRKMYAYGDQMGYLELGDGGHWFSLDYFGRE